MLEEDLAQTAENLGEEARRKRESKTNVVHDQEPLQGKEPITLVGSALDGAPAMQRGFPGWMWHFADSPGGKGANSQTEPRSSG